MPLSHTLSSVRHVKRKYKCLPTQECWLHAQAFTYGFPGRILDQPATKYRLEVVVLIQVVKEAERLVLTLDQEWQFHLDIAYSTNMAPRC